MKNVVKGLSQAFLMLIAILGFNNVTTEPDEEHGEVKLAKKVSPGADLDIQLTANANDLDKPCRVSIFNPGSWKEVFKRFPNVYEAVAYIRDGHAHGVLYNNYMSVCRQDGPFDMELKPYYAMMTNGKKTEFTIVESVKANEVVNLLQDKILELFGEGYHDGDANVNVTVMPEDEAKKFAGFILGKQIV